MELNIQHMEDEKWTQGKSLKMLAKTIIVRAGLVLLGSIIALIFLEIYFRLFNPQLTLSEIKTYSFPCFQEREHRWITLKKNSQCLLKSKSNSFDPVTVKTNSLGFRNPEITLQKPQDTKRVLFLGDSFVMGWGIKEEKSLPRVTETLLRKELGNGIQVINAGFSAAGLSGYYLSLKLDGLNLDPDIIVVGFYLGNDITARQDVEWKKVDENGLPDVIRSKSSYVDSTGELLSKDTPLRYKIPILRESHLFIFLSYYFLPLDSLEVQADNTKGVICVFNKDCHDLDKEKAEIRKLLVAMDTMAKKEGKHLIVALIPTNFQVHFNIAYKTKYDLPFLPTERRSINDEFINFFKSQNIDYIDLLPPLLENSNKGRLYFATDEHWSPLGISVAAKSIAEKLIPILD